MFIFFLFLSFSVPIKIDFGSAAYWIGEPVIWFCVLWWAFVRGFYEIQRAFLPGQPGDEWRASVLKRFDQNFNDARHVFPLPYTIATARK